VFVHLAQNKDPDAWAAARDAGTLVGRNDATPYGYGRARGMGCEVAFSRGGRESPQAKVARLGLRVALGFDLLHARRQRDAIMASDVVWTHTESQFLGVAAVVGDGPRRPLVIGQAVWLMDGWPRMPAPQRAVARRLMRRVDVLTTHSPLNAEAARRLFPGTRVEVVPFGIPSEDPVAPTDRAGSPPRVVAVGNDRHRDWATLVRAASAIEGCRLDVLSGSAPASLVAGRPGMRIAPARTNAELAEAYAGATVAVVPLHPNLHASGATVVQEAVLAGVPVVATDAGGLRSYFPEGEVTYVPCGDAGAMAGAIAALAADPARARAQAERAQRGMAARGIGAEAYVRRHVELTRELLA
jgi:glycosyltransferase involved in cell wall biosynthesis